MAKAKPEAAKPKLEDVAAAMVVIENRLAAAEVLLQRALHAIVALEKRMK